MLTSVLYDISIAWVDHIFLVMAMIYSFICFWIDKSQPFPIFMWLPLTEFAGYIETVFSIDITTGRFPTSLVILYKSKVDFC